MMKNLTLILILFVGFALCAHTQEKPKEKKHYEAVRIENAPSIDGDLDDDAWQHNNWEDGLIQHEP